MATSTPTASRTSTFVTHQECENSKSVKTTRVYDSLDDRGQVHSCVWSKERSHTTIEAIGRFHDQVLKIENYLDTTLQLTESNIPRAKSFAVKNAANLSYEYDDKCEMGYRLWEVVHNNDIIFQENCRHKQPINIEDHRIVFWEEISFGH